MTTIQVRTKFEGVHCYPGAPDEVAYLREPHRHIFGVCVEVEVFDEDRELEFIMLKHMVDGYISNWAIRKNCCELGTSSCESIAINIYKSISKSVYRADERFWKVTVDEDGENGASVEYHGMEQLPKYICRQVEGQMGKFDAGTTPWTLAEYQKYAYQNIQEHCNQKEEMMHWAIGLGEEAGEALSVVKHRYYAGCYKEDDDMLEDLVNELGDVLWHISALCSTLGIDLEDVARYNVGKLKDRYPDGKFDESRSQNRHGLYYQWALGDESNSIMHKVKEKRGKRK